ncbi:MAG: GNVR domain-containing protein [bacterium]
MARFRREKNIWDYFQIVYKHRWVFLIPFCVITLGATIGSFFLPKVYEAETTILFKEKGLMNPLVSGLAYQVDEKDWVRTLEEEIKSWLMLNKLIDKLGLAKDIVPGDNFARERLVRGIRDRISINVRGYNVAKISYRGNDPKEVQEVVNTIADLFIEENRSEQGKEASEAISFLEEQRETYFQRLTASREVLARFQQEHPLELPTDQKANLERLVELESSIKQNELAIEDTSRELRLAKVQLPMSGNSVKTSTADQLRQELAELTNSLKKYKDQYTEGHPAVIATQAEIEAKKQAMEREKWQMRFSSEAKPGLTTQALEENIAKLEERLASLKQEQHKLLTLKNEYEQRTRNIPIQEQQHTKLEREVELNAKLYAMISERLENARISHRLEGEKEEGPFKILDPARYPIFPSAPRKKLIAFLGLCIGSIIGFIGCLVREQIQVNSSLKEIRETEGELLKRRRAA